MALLRRIFPKKVGSRSIERSKKIALRLKGFKLLTGKESLTLLSNNVLTDIEPISLHLPSVLNEGNPDQTIFKSYSFKSVKLHVWKIESDDAFISRHGSVVIKNKVLCTDWNHRGFEKDIFKADNRTIVTTATVIAPFSHYQHPFEYGGYYDFVFFVAAKLSRIKDSLNDSDIKELHVTYHPFGGHYEKEYLELLGYNFNNFIDSRSHKVISKTIIAGNGGTWLPHINDINSLKKNVRRNLTVPYASKKNRIYISRIDRRTIINEAELIALLLRYDFLIIEDKKRSVPEQIDIYQNASFIMGPHGASFANIIWCEPGTQLFELFSRSYAPDYFLYLAKTNNMQYSAYQDEETTFYPNFEDALYQNIKVSIEKLEASLKKIFL